MATRAPAATHAASDRDVNSRREIECAPVASVKRVPGFVMGLSSYSAAEIVMKRSVAGTNAYDDGTGMWPLPEADLREHGFRFTIADVRPTRDVRPAAVAGLFYPAEPEALRARIAHCLNASGPYGSDGAARPPKMGILPPAGRGAPGAGPARASARGASPRGPGTTAAL